MTKKSGDGSDFYAKIRSENEGMALEVGSKSVTINRFSSSAFLTLNYLSNDNLNVPIIYSRLHS